jgi:SAM-dependent methyltransferase
MDQDMSIEWEPVDKCPVCGWVGIPAISNMDLEINDTIHVYYCPKCLCSYHNPRMSQNSMIEYYNSGFYRSHPSRFVSPARGVVKKSAAALKVYMIEGFRRDVDIKINTFLDYGCGRGYLLRALEDKYGSDGVGYDLYHDPGAVVEIVDSKEKITGKFDLITCCHVLEHLPNPIEELDWMVSMLNEGGILFLEIPFVRLVFPAHPILFSRESVFYLMRRIKARYIFYDTQYLNGNGLIVAQPNHPTDYSLAEYNPQVLGYFREEPE